MHTVKDADLEWSRSVSVQPRWLQVKVSLRFNTIELAGLTGSGSIQGEKITSDTNCSINQSINQRKIHLKSGRTYWRFLPTDSFFLGLFCYVVVSTVTGLTNSRRLVTWFPAAARTSSGF